MRLNITIVCVSCNLIVYDFLSPNSTLSVHPTRLVKKRYEISSPATIPVFQIEVTKEVIRDMVGVTARVGGAYWTYNLLAHICVKTSYVFLEESQYCINTPHNALIILLFITCNDVSVNPILPQKGQVKD